MLYEKPFLERTEYQWTACERYVPQHVAHVAQVGYLQQCLACLVFNMYVKLFEAEPNFSDARRLKPPPNSHK